MLLRDFYHSHFEPLKLRSRADDTKRLYVTTINSFERFLKRRAALVDLNDDTVGRFLSWFLGQPGGRSPYSANKERSNLLAIWRFAYRRNGDDGTPLVKVWPTVQPEKEPRDEPMAWLEGDLAKLFGVFDSLAGSICGILECHWWRALHCVLWDTGERIRAIMQLTWANVDLDGGYVTVPAATRKGGMKGLVYKLHQNTADELRKIKSDRGASQLVFPWGRGDTYLWYRYSKILAKAGLPNDRKSKFHRMRRSVASHAEAAGLNATELLGHSSRKVTQAYLDPRIVQKKQAADVLFRPAG